MSNSRQLATTTAAAATTKTWAAIEQKPAFSSSSTNNSNSNSRPHNFHREHHRDTVIDIAKIRKHPHDDAEPSSNSNNRNSTDSNIDIRRSITGSRSSNSGGVGGSSSSSISSSEQVVTSLQVNSKKAAPSKQADANKLPETANSVGLVAGLAEPTAEQQPAPIGAFANKKQKKPKHVLDPSGSVYYRWSFVVGFAFLYNFWSLSYRFAFEEINYDTMFVWFALDYSADFIYLMDIVINSRTGYLEDGVLQKNVLKVRHHYFESTLFYLDGLCLLPLDVLYLSFGFNSILRCSRLVKIYKFWFFVDRTERHTNYPNVFRTFTLVHYIVVIFHWNACLFHMISKNSEYPPPNHTCRKMNTSTNNLINFDQKQHQRLSI